MNVDKNIVKIVDDKENLIDLIKNEKKFSYEGDLVKIHNISFCGNSPNQKYVQVFNKIEEKYLIKNNENNLHLNDISKISILISKLDDIAWLTNLRGNDIEYNPVFFSYGILTKNIKDKTIKLLLFSNKDKFNTDEIKKHLEINNIQLFSYDYFFEFIEKNISKTIFIADKNSINQRLFEKLVSFDANKIKIFKENPIEYLKSKKNENEISSLRKANLRDGLCLIRFYSWLQNILENSQLNKSIRPPTEYECSQKLIEFRKMGEFYQCESFCAISSSGPNGAIIHYKPDERNSSIVDINNIYLLDSGSQYLDGTTDITRSLYFGKEPSKFQKEIYTRVLLGNLSIERCKFDSKKKVTGSILDSLARQYLWHISEDFQHGTGHGVGFYLNVHEGPHGISPLQHRVKFEEGMIVTNEPGFYLKNQFGIRIENNLLIKKSEEFPNNLYFENLTLVPYENKLIDFDLISKDMLKYIDSYHEKIRNSIEPLLNLENEEDEKTLKYLKEKTKPLINYI